MKRFLALVIIILVCKVSAFASHIVGGEFELLHIRDFRYRLNMILYFDDLNGNVLARDEFVSPSIYRKSDNTFVRTVTLNQSTDQNVPYSNSECDDGRLVTSRLLYTTEIVLPADIYSDPEGYYISWERCCRNYTVDNIFSNDPEGSGIAAGQTFYLEFPPVTIDGEPFVNSTPRLFPPLRDYGCVGKFYFVDFGGTDDDGDSLVYSMVTPYSTIDTRNAFPISPNPGPYPDVIWRPGFGIDNVIDGEPDLDISTVGLLTGTPSNTGLYVFAVKCEEFRDGIKIGEMRRDFQMLVVSNCENEDPVIRARESGKSDFYREDQTLNFQYTDANKCVEILITDKPAISQMGQVISARAIPINFDATLEDITITQLTSLPLNTELDTARFEVCFPDCPYIRGRPYKIGIIALDNACPQPALDTVIVTLNVQPPPNRNAYFSERERGARIIEINRQVTEGAGGNITFDINSFDDDGDEMTFEIIPNGFNPADLGMSFTDPVFVPGKVSTTFNWNFDCNTEDLRFSTGEELIGPNGLLARRYTIQILVEDMDKCEFEDPQLLTMRLLIEFPGQTKPEIYESTRRGDAGPLLFTNRLQDRINRTILGRDEDGDNLSLTGAAINFDLATYGLSLPPAEARGNVSSNFLWDVPCTLNLAEQDSFRVEYYIEDIDECVLTNADTLTIDFLLEPRPSSDPFLTARSLNGLRLNDNKLDFELGSEVLISLNGRENEGDSLELVLLNRNELPEDVNFEDKNGFRQVSSVLSWQPDCSVFTNTDYSEDLTLWFSLLDRNCPIPLTDSLKLEIRVEDIQSDSVEFIPPNVFTPNGDIYNNYFAMERIINTVTDERENILPLDNCAGKFERVEIYNRWGKKVYESTDRNFKWSGDGISSGVYFYFIKFGDKKYQGSVSAIY